MIHDRRHTLLSSTNPISSLFELCNIARLLHNGRMDTVHRPIAIHFDIGNLLANSKAELSSCTCYLVDLLRRARVKGVYVLVPGVSHIKNVNNW